MVDFASGLMSFATGGLKTYNRLEEEKEQREQGVIGKNEKVVSLADKKYLDIDATLGLTVPVHPIVKKLIGQGNLKGAGTGTINYETGAIDFTSLPNAEFVLNLVHKSAHSGGVDPDTTNGKNTLQTVGARSINPKLNTTIKILAYN